MATIKSYTDISQSKTLSKILPLKSADMYYAGHQSIINPKDWEYGDTPNIRGKYISFDDKRIFYPCWSLAALLDVLPNASILLKGFDKIYDLTNSSGEIAKAENLIDACVAMIEKLHELNLL